MGAKRCSECGAQLRLRSTLCPLCGAEEGSAEKLPKKLAKKLPKDDAGPDAMVVTADDYQADMRRLREELRQIRDAEAS